MESTVQQPDTSCHVSPKDPYTWNPSPSPDPDQWNHMTIEAWVKVWLPYSCLLVVVPFHLILTHLSTNVQVKSPTGTHLGFTATYLTTYTTVILALSSLIQVITFSANQSVVDILAIPGGGAPEHALQAGLFGLVYLAMVLERRQRGFIRQSIPLLVVWTTLLLSTSTSFYCHTIEFQNDFVHKLKISIDLLHFLGVLLLFSLSLKSYLSQPPTPEISSDAIHPEDTASWWSKLTLTWTSRLLWIGFKRNLEETDIPDLSQNDKCCNVLPVFESSWKREESKSNPTNECNLSTNINNKESIDFENNNLVLNKSKKEAIGRTPSLFRALLRAHGLKYFLFQAFMAGYSIADALNPLLTATLMNHIQNRDRESMTRGIAIVCGMFASQFMMNTFRHRMWYFHNRVSRHMKNGLILLIFKKSLTLQNEYKKDKTNGEILSLITDDCELAFEMGEDMNHIIAVPLKICIALYFLYHALGWPMLFSVGIFTLFIPINGFVANLSTEHINNRAKIKKKRISLLNEILNGIKVIKLYAWERCFMKKVDAIRSKEVDVNLRLGRYSAVVSSVYRLSPLLAQIGSFGIFLFFDGYMDAAKGIVALKLFYTIGGSLDKFVSYIPGYIEAFYSLQRINKYLIGSDISSDVIKRVSKKEYDVKIINGKFSWDRWSPQPTLTKINVSIPKGGLVAVVGMVGSGKSSLLSSILGEMEKLDGEVEIQGRLAYVPQEAWILNTSLRENVLFGSNVDRTRYRQVIHGCSLNNDIDIMEAGDRTEIGEKGINLSGGQKQRVSLARAVYNDADVYLLDDPLSAVDAHVGKHIFNKIISHQGLLKGKTRVLVTHGVQWLPFVDSIIVMKDGQVSEIGTYEELLFKNGHFAQFLLEVFSQYSTEGNKKEDILKERIFNRLTSQDEAIKTGLDEDVKEELRQLTGELSANESDCCNNDNSEDFEEKDTMDHIGALIEEEKMEQGCVKISVIMDYLKVLGIKSIAVFVFLRIITIGAEYSQAYVFRTWTDDPLLTNSSLSHTDGYKRRSWNYFYCFVSIGLIEVISNFLCADLTMKGVAIAGKMLHDRLLNTILKAPMSFFNTTPSSRILSRFTRDISVLDSLGTFVRGFISRYLIVLTALTIVTINVPLIFIVLVPIGCLYYLSHRLSVSTTHQLRRYKSKYSSPILAHFSETLDGVSSIRAFGCEKRFIENMESKIDDWSRYDSIESAVGLNISLGSSFLHLTMEFFVGLLVVMDTRMTSGMAGFLLMCANEVGFKAEEAIGLLTILQTKALSLERILDYIKNPTEAPWDIPETNPSSDWPSDGRIVLNDCKVRYREGLDLVLKGVNCDIGKGEKIGIVGRTGAGKSSLTLALFRLIEAANGYIQIDNEMIARLGLHDLRSKITILPQEPVIFAGSFRMNLDPFNNCTADELWTALKHSHLKSFVEGLPNQLDFECGEGGKNLSVGQRQLLCLARTLLRNTKILILDEATAAVDMETDELIQKTIRTEFKECTVLTIAHRLNTIMDYDRVLVLDQGLVKEFDSPNNLLSDKQSLFYRMAKDAKLVN